MTYFSAELSFKRLTARRAVAIAVGIVSEDGLFVVSSEESYKEKNATFDPINMHPRNVNGYHLGAVIDPIKNFTNPYADFVDVSGMHRTRSSGKSYVYSTFVTVVADKSTKETAQRIVKALKRAEKDPRLYPYIQ